MRDNGPPAVLSPGDVVKGYTVVRHLDQGGFGTVYLATNDGQPCALKLVERQRVEGRVEREITILLSVKHPNVVGIRGFSYWQLREREFALIAMEYVEGRKLSAWVKEENPSARRIAKVTLDVARALVASHEAGVVHRDVKDANVMVRDADGLAVLVDYGIGDYKGAPGITQSMLPPGTMEYRPPEAWLFMEQHAGHRGARYVSVPSDDMWALGTVLYRLLTARLPFDEATDPEYVQAVIGKSPVPPHLVNRFVPERLGMLCMRLLEKDPAVRPDASAVCAALEELLAEAEREAWDTPLFEAYGPNSATTEGEVNALTRWAKRPLRQMRRGKAPGPELPAVPGEGKPAALPPEAPLAPAATRLMEAQLPGLALEAGVGAEATMEADAAPQAAPVPPVVELGRRSFLSRLRMGRVLGVGLLAVALTAGAILSQQQPSPPGARHSSSPGQEVAPYTKKPQAAPAAAPTGPEATPAAVVPPATLPEVTATVTTPQSDTPSSPPVPAKKATRSARSALATTVLCGAMACTGPQVRPAPDSEPCPEGATKGMKMLGMDIGDDAAASFVQGEEKYVTVREGPAQIIFLASGGATLSGRQFVADRLYVRLTRARTSKGSFPVCLEVLDTSRNRGLEIEGGGGDSGKARVYSAVFVKAVSEFE
ncbi:serine/threonine-protein kinase [Corallococcus exiguus]|uniref:Protein kinase n=1 Tax=Corallococcus exiguus TaxID=83462 RepID=A0A7X4Y9T7_9BACT|nr:serine/threonine-protein kinase [Corallococcus exiguus]NBC41483.1 protein kinase [Corallococcus exiguus]TNV61700.1 serine/threonine protein kinase [Corallococcus exiguus]